MCGRGGSDFCSQTLFLCTVGEWKLLDRVGVGCSGWHCGPWVGEDGKAFNHLLACAFLKLELSL